MIKEILKYQGNANYICILCSNEKNELFIVYALAAELSINIEHEATDFNYDMIKKFVFNTYEKYEVNISLKKTNKNTFVHLIKINNEEEYKHICSVVESLA